MKNQLAQNLCDEILQNKLKLHKISEEEASFKSDSSCWSKKEILGHLIDSASNNHQRFVRAQFKDDLIFDGYVQDDWVRVQNYQDIPFEKIIELWTCYNLHLTSVIENIPGDILRQQRGKHNLNKIAFNTVPLDKPTTLEYFIKDYIIHLRHHLDQIFSN